MQPQLFNFKGQQVRTVTIDGEPYFVGNDVSTILGYSDYRHAVINHVDDEDKLRVRIDHAGQNREMTAINESGLYDLIFDASRQSKNPEVRENARKFRHWVTSEVLPTIRKHGAYMTPAKIEEVLTDPDTIIQLATQLKQEREGRLIAEQKVNELTPKATYYDKVLSDKSLVTITQIAKDYGMSGRAMNRKLHELKVIYKQGQTWLLYAKYQKTGWTHSETVMVPKKDGTEKAVLNTKWTQQGRLGLYELLKSNDIIPLIEQD
ncbi:MAG: phage antirepressor [Limosilactobacillus oris]|jgi:prophage antirepressor-like protein|uniref:phage antirepressor n=1 Tax=Limosilactobacillus oris TaxID=1632 RepID=UPI002431C003|nr:phage antirepressor [Limosilactobacillus oris]MCH3911466.1 phage antirepressor [Limosilactobacillus oris]MCH3938716.1 phage antirepressor [Limosilactobacillus oris]MCI1980156.1 phage antirepressor [Limosilactobacillus oris]MCI2042914.1 phage antirepressor [Limosilactobacillus oris]